MKLDGVVRHRPLLHACIRLAWFAGFSLALCTFLMTLSLRWIVPPLSSFMLQQCMTMWWHSQECHLRYQWVEWEAIAPHMALAVVAAEDQKFPHHRGFDFDAMAQAWQASQEGKGLRGASTISQQVAKNLFLWPGRSFVRKGIEAYFTLLIELLWSKQRILEVYLNVVEFGPGIFGVAAASAEFFNKLPAQLDTREAALLAAVLPNPRQRRADQPSAAVLHRRGWILRQMRQLGGSQYLRAL